MKEQTVAMLYYASFIFMAIGVVLMVWWMKRIYQSVVRNAEKYAQKTGVISSSHISFLVLIKGFPGILIFVLFCIPTFYFAELQQRHDHCVQLLEVNASMGKTKDDFKEDCECIDMDEVEAQVKAKK